MGKCLSIVGGKSHRFQTPTTNRKSTDSSSGRPPENTPFPATTVDNSNSTSGPTKTLPITNTPLTHTSISPNSHRAISTVQSTNTGNGPVNPPIESNAAKANELKAMASSPSELDTADLTTIYHVPNEKYSSIDELMSEKGFAMLKKIDEGGFAKVYLVQQMPGEKLLACKVIVVGTNYHSPRLRDAKSELWVLLRIQHPHIIHLYDHFIVNDCLYLVMQYASAGNLYQFICHQVFDEPSAKSPFAQIVSAVSFMHGHGIAHRDLKLSNILLETDDLKSLPRGIHILVADFGLSRVVYRRKKGVMLCQSYCGTPNYMAPELKQRKRYNAFRADIYSLGVVLFYMLQGEYPFDADDDELALKQALNMQLQWKEGKPVSKEVRELIEKMLQPKPMERLQMFELSQHPWFGREMEVVRQECPANLELVTPDDSTSPLDDVRFDNRSQGDQLSPVEPVAKRITKVISPGFTTTHGVFRKKRHKTGKVIQSRKVSAGMSRAKSVTSLAKGQTKTEREMIMFRRKSK